MAGCWPARGWPSSTAWPDEAARRLETQTARDFFASVFWFSIEFGVLVESRRAARLRRRPALLLRRDRRVPRARRSARSTSREMGTLDYDITHYQPILFAADGIEQLLDVVGGFFAACDDDTPARLGVAQSARALTRPPVQPRRRAIRAPRTVTGRDAPGRPRHDAAAPRPHDCSHAGAGAGCGGLLAPRRARRLLVRARCAPASPSSETPTGARAGGVASRVVRRRLRGSTTPSRSPSAGAARICPGLPRAEPGRLRALASRARTPRPRSPRARLLRRSSPPRPLYARRDRVRAQPAIPRRALPERRRRRTRCSGPRSAAPGRRSGDEGRDRRDAERGQVLAVHRADRVAAEAANYPFTTIEPNVASCRWPTSASTRSPRPCTASKIVPRHDRLPRHRRPGRGRAQGRGARQPVPGQHPRDRRDRPRRPRPRRPERRSIPRAGSTRSRTSRRSRPS